MESALLAKLIGPAIWNGILLILGGVGWVLSRRRFQLKWFATAMLLFNLNLACVLNLFGLNAWLYSLVGDPDVSYNWAGKSVAILATCAAIAVLRPPPGEASLTIRQAPKAWIGWIVVVILCAIELGLALNIPDEPQAVEDFAYQLTMPSLDEELFFRGIFLFCLTRAFGDGPRVLWSNFGIAALISATMFAILHSLYWTGSQIGFSMEAFIFTGICGFLLTWLRLNTGSLVAPMVMHSAINTLWRLV